MSEDRASPPSGAGLSPSVEPVPVSPAVAASIPDADAATVYCSFCAKSQHDVRKIIAGFVHVAICDECVSLCVDILRAEGVSQTSGWQVIQQRIEQFAEANKIKPSLGLLGQMAWALGLEFEFKLTPRDRDTHPKDGDGEAAPLVSGPAPQGIANPSGANQS